MAVEDDMKKIEEKKEGKNIFGRRKLGDILESKVPTWMKSPKGIVEKSKKSVLELFKYKKIIIDGKSKKNSYLFSITLILW